ncbi:unnamed protein product [Rotaria sp. Silwood1]|nr:unnamed protein product [Rotaria sp. Silwood1]CAF4829801.1 unnamed protein product [Rotaria sp. Silwood1]
MVQSSFAKIISVKYETSVNASQFAYLENLIGSLHIYAPQQTQLVVRDTGLTYGQRELLKTYENIEVVVSTHNSFTNTGLIEVKSEFIAVNGELVVRSHQDSLPYIDFIRKRFQLAIVIPFIRSQLTKLEAQLKMSNIYLPCQNRLDFVDLIFYHNEAALSSLENEVHRIGYTNKCYRNIRHLAANLTSDQDRYPLGSAIMWQKLLVDSEDNSISLRALGYTHFFLMEPDTQPIRPLWLDAIIEQIVEGQRSDSYHVTNWWMTGSIYRGSKSIGAAFGSVE